MGTGSAEDRSDVAVLREVLAAVGGRPALAPVHAAASALLAEMDTASSGVEPGKVPPGDIPDVDVPGLRRPRIDQPLGDPQVGDALPGDPSVGILDAEIVGGAGMSDPIGGGSSGYSDHESPTGYSEAGVPTWDSVRDKVEHRTGTALGAEELDHISPAGRTLDEQWNERQASGRKKLEEIRRSMKDS